MANDDVSWGAPDAPPLDPGVLSVIRAFAAGLAEREDSFVQQLHAGIVALIPEMAAGRRALCERLVRSLLWTATASQSPQVAGDTLRWVGARNRLEGFNEAHYADVARVLVLAVRNVSGDAWDNSLGSAWISYFRWAQPYLWPVPSRRPSSRRPPSGLPLSRPRPGWRPRGTPPLRPKPRLRPRHWSIRRTAGNRWPPTSTWRRWRVCSTRKMKTTMLATARSCSP